MTRNVLTLGGLGAAILMSGMLSGCGSDSNSSGGALTPGGNNTPPITTSPPAGSEGSWQGTINNTDGSTRAMEAVILGDGSFWMAYADGAGEILNAAGLMRGKGTTGEDGSFTFSNGTLISLEDANARSRITLDSDYVTGSKLDGTLTQALSSGPISLASPASFTSLYQLAYNNNLTLAHLAGSYDGSLTSNIGKQSTNLNIGNDGAITGSTSNGCTLTGTATQRERSNVFDLAMTFGGDAGCGANAGLSVSGVVSQENRRIAALAMNEASTHSFVFMGRK
jgi:hypothetical protein